MSVRHFLLRIILLPAVLTGVSGFGMAQTRVDSPDSDKKLLSQAHGQIQKMVAEARDRSFSKPEILEGCNKAMPEATYGDLHDEIVRLCVKTFVAREHQLTENHRMILREIQTLTKEVLAGNLKHPRLKAECDAMVGRMKEYVTSPSSIFEECMSKLVAAAESHARNHDAQYNIAMQRITDLWRSPLASGATRESVCAPILTALGTSHPRQRDVLNICQVRVGELLQGGEKLRQLIPKVEEDIQRLLAQRIPPAGANPMCMRATDPVRSWDSMFKSMYQSCTNSIVAQDNPAPPQQDDESKEDSRVLIRNQCPVAMSVALRELKTGQFIPTRKGSTVLTLKPGQMRGIPIPEKTQVQIFASVETIPGAQVKGAVITPLPCLPIDYIDADDEAAQKNKNKVVSYGRGVGYALFDVSKKKCFTEHAQGCEKDGLLWYPKCKPGFEGVGPLCWLEKK